jgi:Mg2+-importing ATPase
VALNVCRKVGIEVQNRLTGKEIENMSSEELKKACEKCHLYSKLSPFQKQRIVKMYQENGHTVGYMGDGINDSPPLKQSDVGISVDSAVDIAKETADIILLEKDLNVLEQGVVSGRRTFSNISKYLKMATSGNFGNMLSVMVASVFLPFLPLLPIHILIQNILCDFAQMGMPFDKVDEDYILKPKKWDTKGITRFMFYFGTISTILDIMCFLVLWFALKFNSVEKEELFQTGWFMFGIISQTLIIHMIRTNKIPFAQSSPSKRLIFSTLLITVVTLIIGFTGIAEMFSLAQLPYTYIVWLLVLLVIYGGIIQGVKNIYMTKYKQWV